MKHIETALKQGKEVIYNNEVFCEENFSDDFREAKCDFKNGSFRIYFNGAFIHLSKTFKSVERKITQLKKDFSLQLKSW